MTGDSKLPTARRIKAEGKKFYRWGLEDGREIAIENSSCIKEAKSIDDVLDLISDYQIDDVIETQARIDVGYKDNGVGTYTIPPKGINPEELQEIASELLDKYEEGIAAGLIKNAKSINPNLIDE